MIPVAFISTQTLIIILVIALLVFGPEKLPDIGRQIGSAMRDLRKMSGDVQKALDIDGHNAYDYYNHSSYDSTSYSYTPPVTENEPLDQYGLEEAHPVAEIEAPETTAVAKTDPAVKPAEVKPAAVAKSDTEKPEDVVAESIEEDGVVAAAVAEMDTQEPMAEVVEAEAVSEAEPAPTPVMSGDKTA